MAIPNISEIITAGIESRTGKAEDNVSKNNALLMRLNEKGNIKTVSGGTSIRQEMQYAENGTYKRYSGYEQLNISPSDVLTSAEFAIKQAAIAVTISGLEELQNQGKEKSIDLLEMRINNAFKSFENNFSADCYSAGTADGGKQIGGLNYLVAATPTSGVVGGIDRAAWSFWQNYVFAGVADGGAAVSSANIMRYMNTIYLNTTRGTDHVDLIVMDNNYYSMFEESLLAIQRFSQDQSKLVKAGFQAMRYKFADVVLDGGYGGSCPTNTAFFLNTDYLYLRPMAGRNIKQLPPDRFAVNQDAMVRLIAWAGNMTMSNAFLQGRLKA